MEVEIKQDLLTIMSLQSLPSSYENFRCAIETQDDLPNSGSLKIRIIEETDSRKTKKREDTPEANLASGVSGCQHKNSGKKGKEQNATKP